MNNSLLKTAYQQQRKLVVGSSLCALASVIILLTLLFHKVEQLDYAQHTALKQANQNQRLVNQLNLSLNTTNTILSATSAQQFEQLNGELVEQLKTIRPLLSFEQRRAIEHSLNSHTNTQLVTRLSASGAQNSKLKQQSSPMLASTESTLTALIAALAEQQASQQAQVVNGRASTAVTRRYAQRADVLGQLYLIQQHIKLISQQWLTLGINADFSQFAELSGAFEQATQSFLAIQPQLTTNEGQQFVTQFERLEKHLVSEGLTLSKWRGHIRLAQPFIEQVQSINDALQSFVVQQSSSEVSANDVPSFLTKLYPEVYKRLSPAQQDYLIGAVAIFLAFAALIQLVILSRRMADKATHLKRFNHALQNDKNDAAQPETEEQAQLLALHQHWQGLSDNIETILTDKAEAQRALKVLAQDTRAVFWQLPWRDDEQAKQLYQLAGWDSESASQASVYANWRRLSSSDRKQILAALKTAKATGEAQQLTLSAKLNINLSIHCHDNQIFGTASSSETSSQLSSDLAAEQTKHSEHLTRLNIYIDAAQRLLTHHADTAMANSKASHAMSLNVSTLR